MAEAIVIYTIRKAVLRRDAVDALTGSLAFQDRIAETRGQRHHATGYAWRSLRLPALSLFLFLFFPPKNHPVHPAPSCHRVERLSSYPV